ncbi:MAG: cytochrome C [Syntrophaceae bacterium]
MRRVSMIFVAMLTTAIVLAGCAGKGAKRLAVVSNDTYKKRCGLCHFAYQPGLLPSKSWVKIIEVRDAHPGGTLSLDEKTIAELKSYLTLNSAENSQSKLSKKIMDSTRGDVSVRISEIPYIKRKHRDVAQDVFARKAIGSGANCIACHKSAEAGVYDDDDVLIPE